MTIVAGEGAVAVFEEEHTSLFRRLQLVSAGLYSLGHGGNDAQKTMGIIALALFTVPSSPIPPKPSSRRTA